MIVLTKEECPQGSEIWQQKRIGRITASQFKRILTPGGKLSAQADEYAVELIAQCFVPTWAKWEGNAYTDRGQEMEPEARQAYVDLTGNKIIEVGFITRDDQVVGASPDCLVVDDAGKFLRGVEIKNPAPHTHIAWKAAGVLPPEHAPQCHGGLVVTGLDEWDFFSHFPGLKPLHVVVKRNDYTKKLEDAVNAFVIRYAELREQLIPQLMLTPPSA